MDAGTIVGIIAGIVTTLVTVAGGLASIWKLLTDKITAVHNRVNQLQEKIGTVDGDNKLISNDVEHLKGDLAQVMTRVEKKLDKLEGALEAHMKDEPVQLRELLRQELDRRRDP